MMVKLTQDLARGFKPWKDMFLENEATLNALGAKLVFAGTEKDNDNKLTDINDFENLAISNEFQELTGIAKIDNWEEYIFPVDFFGMINSNFSCFIRYNLHYRYHLSTYEINFTINTHFSPFRLFYLW